MKSSLISKFTLILTASFSLTFAVHAETSDRYSDTVQTFKPLALNKLVSGNLERAKEVNYFKINLKKAGTLNLESFGNTDTTSTLLDKTGKALVSADTGGSGKNFKLNYPANPAIYYLAVKHAKAAGIGAYQVKASLQTANPTTNFIFPFSAGQTWTVCQGYNTPEITHSGPLTYSLDLSLAGDSVSSGAYGCLGSANASTGQNVLAPQAGTVAWVSPFTNDLACISLATPAANGAKSVLVGHFTPLTTLSRGTVVKQGDILGVVDPASSKNGNYAHIHISTHTTNNCLSSGTLVADSVALGQMFGASYNFMSNGSKHQWYGSKVSR